MTDTTTPHAVPFLEDSDSLGSIAAWSESIAEWVNDNVGRHASGSVLVDIVSAGTAAVAAVSFPAGRFSVAPIVTATPVAGASGLENDARVSVDSITTTGCNVRAARTVGTADITVNWHAHQE